jgi:spermidine/putrescine transport system substrate-binding protein
MTREPHIIKILAPEGFGQKLTRRGFLQVGGAAAGLTAVLTACGGGSDSGESGGDAPATDGGATEGSAAPGGESGSGVLADFSTVINKSSGNLAMYTWGEYNDPEIVGAQADTALGVSMQVSSYGSNEELISKLEASKGTSGYDIIVPTGPYIPQMIEKGLLEKFDKAKLPNLVNVDAAYLGQAWDPTNDYSVCKDWGSTGYMWNSTIVTEDIKTWADFIKAAQGPASGQVSVLDTAVNLSGMYFFANGIDWNTEDPADLDAAEKFLVEEFAPHLKGFESYPSSKMAEGAYALCMAWNGDARQGYARIEEAGGNPDEWKWALGSPETELWMDNYAIATGAPNIDAAHAWINWILSPEISIQDLQYHGYNNGMKNISGLIDELAPGLPRADMIFFGDDQVKSMKTQKITSAQDRLVEIYNKVKAAAGA